MVKVLITGISKDFPWTVFNTLGLSTAQVAGNGYLLIHGDVDGTERTGGCTFPAADAEFLVYLVYPFLFSADSLCRTHAYAYWIGTVVTGDRKIDHLGFIGNHLDTGEGRVEDLIVGKRADQLTYPASGALGRKITFLKNHPF
jgi:hypothetical protein